ncbi:MAG: hypothetical protein JNM98_18120 [Rhodocyclaceae bacterium]|nr:hypothetical protein [Rhodocyclaceae bacterium]
MLTKSDFQSAIRDSVAKYPAVAALYQAGDPRIMQQLDAVATMLAMLSAQIEVAASEPFQKTRDATVLADAAMRGIVRKGSPARARVLASNTGTAAFAVESGRSVLDSAGRLWRIETAASVPAGGQASFEASQIRTAVIQHTVSGSAPFYAIEIPPAEDDSYLCAIAVGDGDGSFEYRDRYVNTAAGERVFHVEADDRQRVYVRFGFDGVVGVQPNDGASITLTVFYTAGAESPSYGSPFSFEYLGSPAESAIELRMDALLVPGQNPISMSALRDLARYPSVYDGNAVFLGEFDFLVRRTFPTLQFLSVWNESAEEQARGPNIANMNTLFVACLSAGGGEAVLVENDPGAPVAPAVIAESALTGTQSAIKAAILGADDSYRVRFYTPVRSKIRVTIAARVSTSYIASDVRQKISEVLLAEFGEGAPASRRGRQRPLYQRVYALLRAKVMALSDGEADLKVSITDPESVSARPEMWRYLDPETLTISVETANIVTPSWGG